MRGRAVVLTIGLAAGSCSDEPSAVPEPTATAAPAATSTTGATPEDALDSERTAAIEAWAGRPFAQMIADGFDLTPCMADSAPDDGETDERTVHGLGWAFLSLPLEVVDIDGGGASPRPAVALTGDEVHPNPVDGYVPTHAWIDDPDIAMLDRLTDTPATATAEVALGIGPTDQGRGGRDPERLALAEIAWILTADAVIPFSGECDWIATFTSEVGDPVTVLPVLRSDPYRRAELAGLTGDELDFGDCMNIEPGLQKRVGFGGGEVGLAFGPWPSDAATFTDIDLTGWTVLPPAGEQPPRFAERVDEGFPDGTGLDPNGWLFTFTVEDNRAVVHTLYSTDPVLGLRIWASQPSLEEGACFESRQVLAFREFLDDAVPDRPAWDLSPVLPGDEEIVIETLDRLMTDARARERFQDWTPCTYKLCELNDEVER